MLKAISPIDGRYASKTANLQDYFSEYALIKFRVLVEIKYLLALANSGLPQVQLSAQEKSAVGSIFDNFSEADAASIKETEKTIKKMQDSAQKKRDDAYQAVVKIVLGEA